MYPQLGKAVTAVLDATYPDVDYCIEPELNGVIFQAQLDAWDRAAQRYGFRDMNALRDEVEARTSYKWVFTHLPIGRCFLD